MPQENPQQQGPPRGYHSGQVLLGDTTVATLENGFYIRIWRIHTLWLLLPVQLLPLALDHRAVECHAKHPSLLDRLEAESLDVFKVELAKLKIPVLCNY